MEKKAKPVNIKKLTEQRKAKASQNGPAAAKRLGIDPSEIYRTSTGVYVLTPEQTKDEKRQMAIKHWADSVDDITPEMVRQYRKECAEQEEQIKAKPIKPRHNPDED